MIPHIEIYVTLFQISKRFSLLEISISPKSTSTSKDRVRRASTACVRGEKATNSGKHGEGWRVGRKGCWGWGWVGWRVCWEGLEQLGFLSCLKFVFGFARNVGRCVLLVWEGKICWDAPPQRRRLRSDGCRLYRRLNLDFPPQEELKQDHMMGVSKINGTPKSSILIGFSIIFTIHSGA